MWSAAPDAASANLQWPAESSDEVPVLYAEQPQCQPGDVQQSHELLTAASAAPSPELEEAPSINLASLISPPAQLGQAPSNPPYTVLRVHVDHLGSTRRVTNPYGTIVAEHDFLPFGEEITPFEPWGSKLFTGHERDEATGLDYMLARYASPAVGRFLSIDPAAASMMPSRTQSWNRYSYVMNNPMLYIDPTGENLNFSGFAGLANEVEDIANDMLFGEDLVVDEMGGAHLVPNGDQGPPTEEQAALSEVLRTAIDSDQDVNIPLVSDASDVLIGRAKPAAIDLGDIVNVATHDGPTAAGTLGHEIQEQYAIQVEGKSGMGSETWGAHKAGIDAENRINGTTRLPQIGGPTKSAEESTDLSSCHIGTPMGTQR